MTAVMQLHAWTIAIAILCAVPCALLGCYLVLQRISLMGDAISHAILPGLAIGFLISQSLAVGPMFAGALSAALVTAVGTRALARLGKVYEDAAMGVMFSSLFALGVVLIGFVGQFVDLDPSCVLYGTLELAAFQSTTVAGVTVPRAFAILSVTTVVVVALILIFYKELKIASFDRQLATALGFNAEWIRTGLLALVSCVCISAFETVGSILVIAMLIVPAATAHLLTDRLSRMLPLSAGLASLAAVLGYFAALPTSAGGLYFLDDRGNSAAGMISVVLGLQLALAVLFAPGYGLLARFGRRLALSRRIRREDALAHMYRRFERDGSLEPMITSELKHAIGGGHAARVAVDGLLNSGDLAYGDGKQDSVRLTDRGEAVARTLVRRHRMWEDYLVSEVGLSPDHVHQTASDLEHVGDVAVQDALNRKAGSKLADPHGKSIPPRPEP